MRSRRWSLLSRQRRLPLWRSRRHSCSSSNLYVAAGRFRGAAGGPAAAVTPAAAAGGRIGRAGAGGRCDAASGAAAVTPARPQAVTSAAPAPAPVPAQVLAAQLQRY